MRRPIRPSSGHLEAEAIAGGSMMHNALHLSIVSQNEIKREGLRRILESSNFIVDHVLDGFEEFQAVASDDGSIALIIVDDESDSASVDLCRKIHAAGPHRRILILARDTDIRLVAQAFSAGADGYVSQETSCASLVEMIKLIALGEKLIPSHIVFDLASMSDRASFVEVEAELQDVNLSVREVETLRSLVLGEPNKIISRRLGITEATVKVHVKAILRKLKVVNRTQAAIWGVSRGLISAEFGEDCASSSGNAFQQMLNEAGEAHYPRLCIQ